MILFYLEGNTNEPANGNHVFQNGSTYVLEYPCNVSTQCTNYFSDFPPGRYTISLYGASGGSGYETAYTAYNENLSDCIEQENVDKYGGNTICLKKSSRSGAGGYTSGVLNLRKVTRVYISIGGVGEWKKGNDSYLHKNRAKGGYNGGGDGFRQPNGCGGGGGATDFRLHEDDFWHRILVAGGGGGSDNVVDDPKYKKEDDGSGGAGGGKEAQGFWIDGNYNGNKIATQISGFTFGNGESSQQNGSLGDGFKQGLGYSDRPGAGGGWFGGFAGHHGNGGSGGGSSFAFTEDATIPNNPITSYSSYYDKGTTKNYAFNKDEHKQYFLHDVIFAQGIWSGNGKAIIIYQPINFTWATKKLQIPIINIFIVVLIK